MTARFCEYLFVRPTDRRPPEWALFTRWWAWARACANSRGHMPLSASLLSRLLFKNKSVYDRRSVVHFLARGDADMAVDGPGINRPVGGSEFKQVFVSTDYYLHKQLYFRMSKAPQIRPDYDTDVLWKPPTRAARIQKERTISMDSTDSEIGALGGRKFSTNEGSRLGPTTPIDVQPRARRMSISEMLFGSSPKSFSWGMDSSSPTTNTTTTTTDIGERKMSITDDPRFKDFMKHQSKIIGDDGISAAGFKRSNYMKD